MVAMLLPMAGFVLPMGKPDLWKERKMMLLVVNT